VVADSLTSAAPSLEQVLAALRAASVPRLAVMPAEAAELLGVSPDFFRDHILPDLRVVRRGRKVLVALRELERWLDANAARTLEGFG
jgi:hypothetical protein